MVINYKELLSSFLLFFLLFMSNKSFDFYYVGVIFLLILLVFQSSVVINRSLLLVFLFFSLVFFLRTIILFGNYDLKELLKFVLAFGILSLVNFRLSICIKIVVSYIFLDFTIGILQFFHIPFWGSEFINSFYGSEVFFDLLSADNVRAYSLSSSSGSRGAVLILIFLIVNNFKFGWKYAKSVLIFFLSVSIIIAQSKTAFVILVMYALYSLFRFSKLYFILFMCIVLLYGSVVLSEYLIYFSEYYDLLENGLNTSSVTNGRFVNWNYYLNGFVSNPMTFLFGPGRDFYDLKGEFAPAFDSDYLYLLVNFGFLGALFVGGFLFTIFLKSSKITKFQQEILLFGLVCGLSINFFFDIKVLFLLMFLFSNRNLRFLL